MMLTNDKWITPKIHPIPELVIIERTSFEVNIHLHSIVTRIVECLRLRSVQAAYDNEKFVVKCTTSSNTKFHINLYEVKPSSNILVEIQHRMGNSTDFHDEFIALCDAIKKNKMPSPQKVIKNRSKIDPEEEMRLILGEKYIPLSPGVIEASVQMAAKYVMSSSTESVYFGLQELVRLSNPYSTSRRTSLKVSQIIMMNDEHAGLRDVISKTVILSTKQSNGTMEEAIFKAQSSKIEGVAVLGLTLLVNMLQSLNLNEMTNVASPLHFACIMPSLVKFLKSARINMNKAFLAAKFVSLLIEHSQFNNFLLEIGQEEHEDMKGELVVALEIAKRVGTESYYQLEKEATEALNHIA